MLLKADKEIKEITDFLRRTEIGSCIGNRVVMRSLSNGRFVLAGTIDVGDRLAGGLRGSTEAGVLDETFEVSGHRFVQPEETNSGTTYEDIAIDDQDNIVVAGSLQIFIDRPRFFIMKFDSDGVLDLSFSGGGIAVRAFDLCEGCNDLNNACAVAAYPDGSVVAAGRAQISDNPTTSHAAVRRGLANGGHDELGFGGNGANGRKTYAPCPPAEWSTGRHLHVAKVALLSDGQIALAGHIAPHIRRHCHASACQWRSGYRVRQLGPGDHRLRAFGRSCLRRRDAACAAGKSSACRRLRPYDHQ